MGGVGSGPKSTRAAVDGLEPTCPAYLSEDGRAAWRRVADSLRHAGLLDSTLGEHIAAYVAAALEIEACERTLSAEGLTLTCKSGLQIAHPCVGIRNAAVQRMSRVGAQLGIVNFMYGRATRKPMQAVGASTGDGNKLALRLYEDANKHRKTRG